MLATLTVETNVPVTDEMLSSFEWYLAALFRNGQIHSNYVVSRRPTAAYVDVPRRDSLDPRFLSKGGHAALGRVRAAFGRAPSWRLIEAAPSERARTWRGADALYLVTHAFDTGSPIGAPELSQGVPAYALPLSDDVRDDLVSWAQDYRAHDRVWLSSGPLELPAYKELAVVASDVSKRGRRLCKLIERATGKPTYYYLPRYYAYARAEADRRCPSCGRGWRAKGLGPAAAAFWNFEFRCRRCRLVSDSGVSIDGARYARIGDFAARHRPTKR